MIAADTSSLVAFFAGASGNDVALVASALASGEICLSPIVLTEILSDPKSHDELRQVVSRWTLLEILPEYWERAGHTRATLLRIGLSPKLPDTLIAQSCIDHSVALVTRDADFRPFAKHCGLKLA